VATISGYFQLALAGFGLIEVIRRFIGVEELPDFRIMILVSVLALIANSLCFTCFKSQKAQKPI
jgi:Co/Zn/Cd efflux system component